MLHRFLVRRFTRRARNRCRNRRGTLRLRFPLLEKTVHFLRRLLFRSRLLLFVVVVLLSRQIDNRRRPFFLFCATEFLNIFVQIRRRFVVLSSFGQVNRRRCFRDSLRVVDIVDILNIVRVRFFLLLLSLLFFRNKHRMRRRRLGRTFFHHLFHNALKLSFRKERNGDDQRDLTGLPTNAPVFSLSQ